MAKKKATMQSNAWRFAGEPLAPAALSGTEEQLMEDIFSDFQALIRAETALGIRTGNLRGRESAIRACLGYFYERFGEEYGRETVTKALTTAVALPVTAREVTEESYSLALGAAFWFLEYVERHNLQAELLALLPPDGASGMDCLGPCEDFRYPPELIRRTTETFFRRKKGAVRECRKLLGLVRKDDAAKLRGAFRDALLNYFNRFLEVCKRVAPSPSPEVSHPFAPPPSALDLFSSGRKRTPPPSLREFSERTPDMAFLMKTPSLIGLPPEKMQAELYYRRMTELLSEFTVENPYEIIAASFLLEREDDLLMNLNTLTVATLACAERHFPWSVPARGKTPELYERKPPERTLQYLFRREPDEADASEESLPEEEMLCVEQLFYLATGYLLPRDRIPSTELCLWFRERGLSEGEAFGLATAAMALSACADARADADSGLWGEAAPEVTPPPVEEREETPEPEDAERAAELNRQVKAAKQAVHEKEQAIRQLEEQLRDERSRAEQDRMELRGLRETLFRIRAGEIPEFDAKENSVRFPYQIRRRVLIFGGHDTWSKSIRPLLPGARFFQRESLPDLNAIKGADVVWIQANALSHKFYYRIIETARRENIAVRYFGFASARKCAEQVAENEMEIASES